MTASDAPQLDPLLQMIVIPTPTTLNQLKLLNIVFFRPYYYYLTGSRIMAGIAAYATTPRAWFSPFYTTTTLTRFFLNLLTYLLLGD
jgi:hypothetical protein